jgi:hypothetical protein
MTQTSPPVTAARVPYRTATIVTLSASIALLILFFVANRFSFGADYSGMGDYTTPFYVLILAAAIACFIVSLVLRSRTKRLGLRRRLATAAVVVSSVLLGTVIVTAIILVATFLLLVVTFLGG